MTHTRRWLTAAILLAAFVFGTWGISGWLIGSTVAHAAAPVSTSTGAAQAQASQGAVRRESGPVSHNGAPLTGAASAYQPLDVPNFGANVRANTDTQSPNLAQQEPSIAVNPTNPLNIVAAAKDERGGSNTKQVWIYTSMDGGATWTNQLFPFISPASPFSSDPVVSFSDDGQCYVTALPYGGGANDGIQVARSLNGGATFSTGVRLPGSTGNSDKEWTWVDNSPSSPFYHRIYVAWMDFGSGSIVRLNYSADRGLTWSPLVTVGTANQFPMPVSLPNGDLIVTYYTGSSVTYRRSTNGGQTFSAAQTISSITSPACPPDNSGCGIWRLSPIPTNSVNPLDGTQVIVWSDGRAGAATIYYTRSTNGGTTFSPAAQLSPPGVTGAYQIEPWVVADEQGIFHAIWYDDRQNPSTSVFNIYYSQSTDDGATWMPAIRITTATTDLRIGIPSSYNLAAGDYINVTASQGNVYGVWTDTRSGSGEDVYVVRGTFGGNTPTATSITTSTATSTSVVATPTSTTVTSSATATGTATGVASGTAISTLTATASSTASSQSTASTATATAPPATTASPTTTVVLCSTQFQDVPASDTFYPFVRCLACRGIIGGYPCGGPGEPCGGTGNPYFRPGVEISRGQIAKIVSQSAGLNDAPGTPIYEDVPSNSPFFLYIQRLSNRGYMGGYPCGGNGEPCGTGNRPYFRPASNATRGQLAKIVSNAAGINSAVSGRTYEDVTTGSPFYPFIERLTARNVMSGYACGRPSEECVAPDNRPYFRPNANVTRGQASKIVANTFFPNCQTASSVAIR